MTGRGLAARVVVVVALRGARNGRRVQAGRAADRPAPWSHP